MTLDFYSKSKREHKIKTQRILNSPHSTSSTHTTRVSNMTAGSPHSPVDVIMTSTTPHPHCLTATGNRITSVVATDDPCYGDVHAPRSPNRDVLVTAATGSSTFVFGVPSLRDNPKEATVFMQ